MNTGGSVYPSFVADKCVEFLCSRHCSLREATAHLTAARFLMMHGYVLPQAGKSWRTTLFMAMSPETPRFYYSVDLRSESCTCAEYLRYQRPCKHILAVVLTLLARQQIGLMPCRAQFKAR